MVELTERLKLGDAKAARNARLLLQRHLQQERDFLVREEITRVLAEQGQQRARAEPMAEPEQRPGRARAEPTAESEKWQDAPPGAAPLPSPKPLAWYHTELGRGVLSIAGIAPAVLAWIMVRYAPVGVIGMGFLITLLAVINFCTIKFARRWLVYLAAAASLILTLFAIFLIAAGVGRIQESAALLVVACALESTAAILNFRNNIRTTTMP